MQKLKRGTYGELVNIPASDQKLLNNLLNGVRNAAKIDEHGGWEFGILESNARKGRVHAMNYDWYAYGRDYHDRRFLAVIQVREFYRRKAGAFANIRKSYFLIGRNEDQTFFAHPVSANVIHSAIRSGRDVIRSIQDWIFGYDYTRIIRQGDVCLIPVRSLKGSPVVGRKFVIEKNHELIADKIFENGEVYAENVMLTHLPGTHPQRIVKGKYKIVVGKRARYWSFAKPTLD